MGNKQAGGPPGHGQASSQVFDWLLGGEDLGQCWDHPRKDRHSLGPNYTIRASDPNRKLI